MKYNVGDVVCISIDALIDDDADMNYVEIMTDHYEDGTYYAILNEFGELACYDGEECVIDHVVNGTTDLYDLVCNNGETNVHFMLSEHDLDIGCIQIRRSYVPYF